VTELIGTADICDEFTESVVFAEPGLTPYGGKSRAAGELVIINIDEDNSAVWQKLAEPGQNRILVVNNSGKYCAVFGDRMATIAVDNGWQAIVVNGFIRDVAIISKMPLGMWALGTCPYKCQGKNVIESSGEAYFLGLTFSDGQYTYIDEDGLLLTQQPLDVEF